MKITEIPIPIVERAPDCYQCAWRRSIVGDCHSRCLNIHAQVEGHAHGIAKGWFFWPYNFDPVWLVSCDSFKQNESLPSN
jgi:hypothetical protein